METTVQERTAHRIGDYINDMHQPLDDIQPGMWILVDHPRRLVRVEGRGTIEVKGTKTEDGMAVPVFEEKPVVNLTALLPLKPIEGFVDQTEALVNRYLADAVLKDGDSFNDIQWQESWATRVTGVLTTLGDTRATLRSESKHYRQLFCIAQRGRSPKREGTGPVALLDVRGTVIPSHLIPDDMVATVEAINERALMLSEAMKEEVASNKQREYDLWKIQAEAEARVAAEAKFRASAPDEELVKVRAELASVLKTNTRQAEKIAVLAARKRAKGSDNE
ncbi:MAG TPA: hypothetical protein VM243_06845 [Phycisphaerae bacterium]|nr:hypothetical protein [Phycisphaerae bacterium]